MSKDATHLTLHPSKHAVIALALGAVSLFCIGPDGCSTNDTGPEETVTVEGVVAARGNEPFSEYVLETSSGDLYVLNIPDSLREGFLTPSRLSVRGRPYDAEWNGREFRHIKVESWARAD